MAILPDVKKSIEELYSKIKENNSKFFIVPVLYILSNNIEKGSYAYIDHNLKKAFKSKIRRFKEEQRLEGKEEIRISDEFVTELYKTIFDDDITLHKNPNNPNSNFNTSQAFSQWFREGRQKNFSLQSILINYVDYIGEGDINLGIGNRKDGDKKPLYRVKPEHYDDFSETLREFVDQKNKPGEFEVNIQIKKMIHEHKEAMNKPYTINIADPKENLQEPQKNTSNIPLNQILYGPPGTGKTFSTVMKAVKIAENDWYSQQDEDSDLFNQAVKERYDELIESGRIVFTTFHQSFSYEDFIEGIRAITDEETKNLRYYIETGVFKKICEDAEEKKPLPHVLIIDEINRGNIARIFGELITLLEASKRRGMDDSREVILPYSKKRFSVPSNLYVIGTMNTADKSLAQLDLALRRRFSFFEVPPNYKMLRGISVYGVDVATLLEVMNQRIEVLLDQDHLIGHTYFLGLTGKSTKPDQENEIARIFSQNIIPLLKEYFFDDWERIGWVLNDPQKKLKNNKFIHHGGDKSKTQLFNDEVSGQLTDRRFYVNQEAFKSSDSYLGIIRPNEKAE